MPSGGGHSSSGGHFGGGASHSSGGHFGGFRGSSGPSMHYHGGWHHPHVTLFFGRPVWISSARAGASSILSLFIVIGIMISVFTGIGWADANGKVNTCVRDYTFYHQLALDKADQPDYQIVAEVYRVEQNFYDENKYCIHYKFPTADGKDEVDGWSFFVYDYQTAENLKQNGVTLALDTKNDRIISTTDSVPLDYKDTVLTDDAEYVAFSGKINFWKTIFFVAIGATVLMVVASVAIPLTAKKATEEQLAEHQKNNGSKAVGTANPATAERVAPWRCEFCGSLNDSDKTKCDACGVTRQK